ncbi:E3 ubiquitin-protein ligase RNF19A-like [Gadus macrocephalus]|uniref:E3 ubiquitin-protein ligase RNF19A-like n=1 Tax=Gadus macrocephalus TaxID=80720 RepID=UPI0028CB8332|nr:E3 ubiquitin-protein ligase RNF19A-like [Gadus macrocephalus]
MNHMQRLPHQQQPQHHGCSGSERDLHSATSSISLPSIRKTPKKRRLSLHSLFGRRRHHHREPRRCKLRPLQAGGAGADVAPAASDESIPTATGQDKPSGITAAEAAAMTSSAAGTTSPSPSPSATACVPTEPLECPLCLLRRARDRFPDIMTCRHRSCGDCLRQYLRIEISESRVNICCPECPERYNPHDIQAILADRAVMEKYEEFMLRRWLVADPDCRWCPAPDCGYAVVAFGCASCPKLTCGREGCSTEFCYHCKQLWHPDQTCDAARQQRAQSLQLSGFRSSSLSYSQGSGAPADDIKPCPRCAAYIIKMNDGSCNHMTCAVCGCEFCWLCMKEISDLHYLSPSGCTFWGKKPWSRKKKILWQLGTLVGAPVGIALIAGIAVPAMVIGIPVYVGRKIHNRYEGKEVSKHKRNLVIAGGVTLSVIVSPVVAAVTVGIGVPIMLAYVYGVVPISLCRSGGCGVSAGNGKGVRIEFDDENDVYVGSGMGAPDTASVAETRLHNPSMGDGASVGGLTGLSLSGSHLERCGATVGGAGGGGGGGGGPGSTLRDASLSDHDDASTTALAGGSMASSCYNRVEVQADVQKEGSSLSGDSASVSLGPAGDNASTRAMAGSILNAYTPLERASSLEVQVDVEPRPPKMRHCSASSSLDGGGGGGGGGCEEIPPGLHPCASTSTHGPPHPHLPGSPSCPTSSSRPRFQELSASASSSAITSSSSSSSSSSRPWFQELAASSSTITSSSTSSSRPWFQELAASSSAITSSSFRPWFQELTSSSSTRPWFQELTSSSSASRFTGKRSKGRLWRKVGGNNNGSESGKAEAEVPRRRKGPIDTETEGRRAAGSPPPGPPSPSGSLPSVASDSRRSVSSSDASETSRPLALPLPLPPTPPAAAAAAAASFLGNRPQPARAAASAMPEVEHDRLEHRPAAPQGPDGAAFVVECSQGGGTFLFIAEETRTDSAVDLAPDEEKEEEEEEEEHQSEAASQEPAALHATSPASRRSCVQTDI